MQIHTPFAWSFILYYLEIIFNIVSSNIPPQQQSNCQANSNSQNSFTLLGSTSGSPFCSVNFKIIPKEACSGEMNYFQLESSESKGDDKEVSVYCAAPFPINLKFTGAFNQRNPTLKVDFDRKVQLSKQLYVLNFSFPADVSCTGEYWIFSIYNQSTIFTKADFEIIPKRAAPIGNDSVTVDSGQAHADENNINNVSRIPIQMTIKPSSVDPNRLFVVCMSELENNVQRLVNVYANNPTEASYKRECLWRNDRCFSKREGSLVQCSTYELSNHTCRSVDLRAPGGLISCFTDRDGDSNYNITKQYYVGINNKYYLSDEEFQPNQLIPSTVIAITGFKKDPWSGTPYEFTCKAATYLLAKSLIWHLVDKHGNWVEIYENENKIDKKTLVMTSKVNITFATNIRQVVCTTFFYNSDQTFKSSVPVSVIASFSPLFKDGNHSQTRYADENGDFLLECKACGIPTPRILWIKDRSNISTADNIVKTDAGDNCATSVLKSTNANKNISVGDKISCAAWNSFGRVTKDYFLKVKESSAETLWTNLGVSLGVSVTVALVVVLLYLRFRKKPAYLTKDEILEFKQGKTNSQNPNDVNAIPENIPYNEEYEIDEKFLILDETKSDKILGSGAFGLVFKGSYQDQEVAIKTIRPYSSKAELKSLLSELKVMQYIGEHKYIAKLVGALTAKLDQGKVLVILEMYSLGSLENFLRTNSNGFVNLLYANEISPAMNRNYISQEHIISTQDLVNWSCQIAEGMAYLTDIAVIHGDLATRNILLADKNTVKIADFGLSRKQYTNFYAKQSHEPVPWRWMAIESLRYLIFSVETDIWSYGVTLWEIFTLAEVPYAGWSWCEEFKDNLGRGLRLPKPSYASPELYEIMLKCWEDDPTKRIKFWKIQTSLHNMHSKFTASLESSPGYHESEIS